MKFLRRIWRKVCGWFGPRRERHLKTVIGEELPHSLDARTVYVAGENGHFWFVAMLCPCGCGETLQMSLLANVRPRWLLTQHRDGSVSLRPSVWRKVGCRSHFFLVHGRVLWCGLTHEVTISPPK
jgi:hypothetical protein